MPSKQTTSESARRKCAVRPRGWKRAIRLAFLCGWLISTIGSPLERRLEAGLLEAMQTERHDQTALGQGGASFSAVSPRPAVGAPKRSSEAPPRLVRLDPDRL